MIDAILGKWNAVVKNRKQTCISIEGGDGITPLYILLNSFLIQAPLPASDTISSLLCFSSFCLHDYIVVKIQMAKRSCVIT